MTPTAQDAYRPYPMAGVRQAAEHCLTIRRFHFLYIQFLRNSRDEGNKKRSNMQAAAARHAENMPLRPQRAAFHMDLAAFADTVRSLLRCKRPRFRA